MGNSLKRRKEQENIKRKKHLPNSVQTDIRKDGYLGKWNEKKSMYDARWFTLSDEYLTYYRKDTEKIRKSFEVVNITIQNESKKRFSISDEYGRVLRLKAKKEITKLEWVIAIELCKARILTQMEEERKIYNVEDLTIELSVLSTMIAKLNEFSSDMAEKARFMPKLKLVLQSREITAEDIENARDFYSTSRNRLYRIRSQCYQILRVLSRKKDDGWKTYLSEVEKWQQLNETNETEIAEERFPLSPIQSEDEEDSATNILFAPPDVTYGRSISFSDGSYGTDYELTEPRDSYKVDKTISEWSVSSDPKEIYISSADNSIDKENHNDPIMDMNGTQDKIAIEIPLNVPMSTGTKSTQNSSNGRNDADCLLTLEEMEDEIAKGNEKCMTGHCENHTKESDTDVSMEVHSCSSAWGCVGHSETKIRRTRIPERPNRSIKLWGFIKNFMGGELAKVSLPLNFSEPLSTLQRLAEEYEYSELLDQAALCKDSLRQMVHVAAFAVSAYSTTVNRTTAPFVALLGETYENDRTDDYGWKYVSEQVCRHPSIAGQHCEGKDWVCYKEFSVDCRLQIDIKIRAAPLGISHLVFPKTGQHYTWNKVTTFVHNLIIGKLRLENRGQMVVENHTTGERCEIEFEPDPRVPMDGQRAVKGVVMNVQGVPTLNVWGTWDNSLEVFSYGYKPQKFKKEEDGEIEVIWERRLPPPQYEDMYNFTKLACQLNEPEDNVCPTDSRLRPDIRHMEEGEWDEATRLRDILEENQREARYKRLHSLKDTQGNKSTIPDSAKWFHQEEDPFTGKLTYVYSGEYWACKDKQDWTRCPNIYSISE